MSPKRGMAPLRSGSNLSSSDTSFMEPSDVSIKHNFAVQKYSKAPYNLKTNASVVPHREGFLATLEWRWRDPSRDAGPPLLAVTSGIHRTKKLALSEAYRAMLIKQKLLDESSSSTDSLVSELQTLVSAGKYNQACRILMQRNSSDSEEPPIPIKSLQGIFPDIWRNILATHDYRQTEGLVTFLESIGDGIPVALYETLVQDVVYLSNFSFAERVLLLLSGERIRLSVPDRAMVNGVSWIPSQTDVDMWKYWRSLLALEELSNIHSTQIDESVVQITSIKIDSVTTPIVRLVSDSDSGKLQSLATDSIVLIRAAPNKGSGPSLTGSISGISRDPNGVTAVTIKLLTEESRLNNQILTTDYVDLVVLSESRVTFDRMIKCLGEFYKVSQIPDHSYKFSETVRRIFTFTDFSGVKLPPPTTPPPNLSELRKTLNLSPVQFAAVTGALRDPLTIVHGPPGTGKTHTLCGIVSAWKSVTREKILACAESNAAADNIFNSLKRKGVSDCFRLTTWKNLSDEIDKEVLMKVKNKAVVDKYRIALRAYRIDPGKNKGYLIGARKALEEEAIAQSQVIVTTLSTSRHPSLDKVVIPRVVIDESAQSIEPSTLLAVSHGCEQLVLVGDHKQLPAVILSREASKMGLKRSVFEKLIERGPDVKGWTSVLLNTQRRMHPTISEFSNKNFYNNKIEDHPDCSEHDACIVQVPWFSHDKRVVLVNTSKSVKHAIGEEFVGTSTRNMSECVGIVEAIDRLLRSNVSPDQIGVIVPYLAQKSLVLNLLRQRIPRENFLRLHINTVEGFQGNEKDFIIISLVRSNATGSIGFVDDDQRMNVMLTRARKGLLVFGDSKTFEASSGGNSLWREWLEWCATHCIKIELDDLVG